jgi:putative transposase
LDKHAGAARFGYNWGLALRIELCEKEKKSTNAIEQHKILNRLKSTQFPWMYEVSKCAPQEALRDLDKAFKGFFRGLKQSQKIGFPKFKKKSYLVVWLQVSGSTALLSFRQKVLPL